jgi:heme exporter protein D
MMSSNTRRFFFHLLLAGDYRTLPVLWDAVAASTATTAVRVLLLLLSQRTPLLRLFQQQRQQQRHLLARGRTSQDKEVISFPWCWVDFRCQAR